MTSVGKTSSPIPQKPASSQNGPGDPTAASETGATEGPQGQQTKNDPPEDEVRFSQRDMFERGPIRLSTQTDPRKRIWENATSRFEGRIHDVLNIDAMSMAQGQTPHRGPLSDAQQDQLKDASVDFLQDMPLGSLAPAFGDAVRQRLRGVGVQLDDINNMSLRDVSKHVGDRAGDFAGDTAKGWADDLKDNSPATYYGLLATGAAAVGTTGYLGGSDALKSIGLRPKFKTRFFDRAITARAEASWDKGFDNFQLGGSLEGRLGLGRFGDVSGGVHHSLEGVTTGVVRHQLSLGSGHRPRDLNDIVGGNTYGHLHTSAHFNLDGLEKIESQLGLSKPVSGFSLAADAGYNFQTDRSQAGLSLRYQPSSNVDFALSGSHDSEGDSRIGVGLRVRF